MMGVGSFNLFELTIYQEPIMYVEQTEPMQDLLTEGWKHWIAENKMLGIDDQQLIDVLVQNGIDKESASREIREMSSHPYFQAGDWIAQRLRKIESLLDAYSSIACTHPAARFDTIERRGHVTREEFLEKYYSVNRPVVLLDMMNKWRARSLWNPDYLRKTCGNELVEVMAGRDSDGRYEINSEQHRTSMVFSEFIDHITQCGRSNDRYMVANNNTLRREGMKHLYDDIEVFPEFLDGDNLDGGVFFWFGPAGTVTPLHHDAMNILMAQVYGRKRVTLIPSFQLHRVYNEVGVFSEVDSERPNFDEFPEFRNVTMRKFILKPGEVLFIPVGWWHDVRSLDVSITVSFTNFLFPNHYEWSQPLIQRRIHRDRSGNW
jgi:ribosomal protein L16 Arg81 hydroxylase